MKLNRIYIYFTLFITLVSCKITSKLEKYDSRVRLTQPGYSKQTDTVTFATSPKNVTYVDKEGVEHTLTRNEIDKGTGEEVSVVDLQGITVTAKSKNVPERFGKVNLDFIVTVPELLISNKWQLRLTPMLFKGDETIELDKIFLSGADFLKTQQKGYAMYQAFINSIVPDSSYLRTMFDGKGYKKAMLDLQEEFYNSWRDDLLMEKEYIDWSNKTNKRYLIFNKRMEHNRRSLNGSASIISNLPSYWLYRELDSSVTPSKYRSYLEGDYKIVKKQITPEDSANIAKKYFDYKRMAENERKKEQVAEKFKKYVKFPYESARLDSVIQNGKNFQYYYVQEISTDDNVKKMDLTLNGMVLAKDQSTYDLPPSDTISYYISSMIQFLDREPRYKLKIIERKAEVNLTSYISYNTAQVKIDEELGSNKTELQKIFDTIEKLTYSGELVMDSINMVASASPEGSSQLNLNLSMQRAKELKTYLSFKTDDKEGIDTLLATHWIGEDWDRLSYKISNSEDVKNKKEILDLITTEKNADNRELVIKTRYKDDYEYIREYLYPELRVVNFKFNLHRRDMVKDTVHTTVLDDYYQRGFDFLENRKYKEALVVLSDYNDYNTAICLMSLGYDNRAYEILQEEKDTSNRNYLLAILAVRLKKEEEAVQYLMRAADQDETKIWRGKLDPEINKLITTYNLFSNEQF